MKRFLTIAALIAALTLVLTACASAEGRQDAAHYRQITVDEAMRIMDSESDAVILDVRTQSEYEQGHIPGAVCVPNESITDSPIDSLPDPDQLILVYCRSGRRSKEAAQKLADIGYTNIVEFGGIIDWPGEIVTD